MEFDLLVIGASAAGWQGAIAAARLDQKVGLVALKPMASMPECDLRHIPAKLLQEVCSDWPIPCATAKPVTGGLQSTSWPQFTEYTRRIWRLEQESYRDQLLAAGGQFWTGDVRFSGPNQLLLRRPRTKALDLRAEHILIASGTMPRSPSFATDWIPPAKQAATILDVNALDSEACVIGASLTGLRTAYLLALWGSRVRVIDGRHLTENLGQEDACNWYGCCLDLGVRFEQGEDVIGLKPKNLHRVTVILESGRQINTDRVWLATSRQGRTADLDLSQANLSTDDCGRLWCNPDFQTWVPSVSAIGDVVGFPPDSVKHPDPAEWIAALLKRRNVFRSATQSEFAASL